MVLIVTQVVAAATTEVVATATVVVGAGLTLASRLAAEVAAAAQEDLELVRHYLSRLELLIQ